MGMYTEIYVNVDLKKETPKEVLDVLRAICEKNFNNENLKDKPERWSRLFNNGSYYVPSTECASLTYDEISNQWSLLGKGDIKNYEREIEKFFEFIKSWCKNVFIGYYRYEEDRDPILVYSDV